MWARAASLVLSLWLMVSIFFWPHGARESMVVGLYWAWVLALLAAAAFVEPRVRYGGAVLGAVLAVYSLFAPHASPVTRWHDFAVGVLIALLAAVPSRPLIRHDERPERRVSS